jgi:hypothetical protein
MYFELQNGLKTKTFNTEHKFLSTVILPQSIRSWNGCKASYGNLLPICFSNVSDSYINVGRLA